MAGILRAKWSELNLLGLREPEMLWFGQSAKHRDTKLQGLALAQGHTLSAFQSNAEHELIAKISGDEAPRALRS